MKARRMRAKECGNDSISNRVAVNFAVKREKERLESRSSLRKLLICLVEPNGIEPSNSSESGCAERRKVK